VVKHGVQSTKYAVRQLRAREHLCKNSRNLERFGAGRGREGEVRSAEYSVRRTAIARKMSIDGAGRLETFPTMRANVIYEPWASASVVDPPGLPYEGGDLLSRMKERKTG
jgi:hypothetical protein